MQSALRYQCTVSGVRYHYQGIVSASRYQCSQWSEVPVSMYNQCIEVSMYS